MSRLTDYGIVVLQYFASHPAQPVHSARDISAQTNLPLPTVSKLLKLLTRRGILISHRGSAGGYGLSKKPENLSVAEIISALEGPIAVTDCNVGDGSCEKEKTCPVRGHWQVINHAIQEALEKIDLAKMVRAFPKPLAPLPIWSGN